MNDIWSAREKNCKHEGKPKKNIWKFFSPSFVLIQLVFYVRWVYKAHRPPHTNKEASIAIGCARTSEYQSVNCNGFSVKWRPHNKRHTSIDPFDLSFRPICRLWWHTIWSTFCKTCCVDISTDLRSDYYLPDLSPVTWQTPIDQLSAFCVCVWENSAWEKLEIKQFFIQTNFWFLLFYWFFPRKLPHVQVIKWQRKTK